MRDSFTDNRGRLSAHAFACGYTERARHVSVSWEHCCYHVKRHPDHPAGHKWETAHTLREARTLAAKLRREPGPEGLTSGQPLT